MSQKSRFRSASLGWLHQLFCLMAIALFSTQLMAAPALATSMYTMPKSIDGSTWILDEASKISRINEGQIASELKALAQNTGNEIRFVTVHHLDYEVTAQSFADELLARWFPTPEARANETVIVLDDVTNTIGISVGNKTANVLTKDIAESVIDETMKVPLLKGNQYNQSLIDASDRLVAVLSGDPDPGPPVYDNSVETNRTYATAEETAASRGSSATWVIALLVAATVIPMATYYWYLSIGG